MFQLCVKKMTVIGREGGSCSGEANMFNGSCGLSNVNRLSIFTSLLTLLFSSGTLAQEVKVTCDGRDIVLDKETSLLDIEVVNNTLLTPDKTFRDIAFTADGDLVRFKVVSPAYIEGWAIDLNTLMAASRLSVVDKPEVPAVKQRYNCRKSDEAAPPEKLPKQPVGKRPRKRGF